jgi:hypothetical protein
MQLDALSAEGCRDGADTLLCDLLARFIDEEYVRRYQRQPRLGYIMVGDEPPDRVRSAAVAARRLAGQLAQRPVAPLTGAESLPLTVFLEQLAVRLEAPVTRNAA